MRASGLIWVLIVMAAGCCRPGAADLRNAPVSPATRAAEDAVTSHPIWRDADVQDLRRDYVAKEGHGRRGQIFSNLAGAIDIRRRDTRPVPKELVIALLGPPDLVSKPSGTEAEYVYFYDRFGKKDWAVYISIENGIVSQIGYNQADVNDHSVYRAWREGN